MASTDVYRKLPVPARIRLNLALGAAYTTTTVFERFLVVSGTAPDCKVNPPMVWRSCGSVVCLHTVFPRGIAGGVSLCPHHNQALPAPTTSGDSYPTSCR